MPYWVRLTASDGGDTTVFVNLENVTHLLRRNPGTRIYLSSGGDVSVAEEADTIVEMRSANANRA